MNAKQCKKLRRAARQHSNPEVRGYDTKLVQRVAGHVMVEGKPQILVKTTNAAKHKAGSGSQVYKFLKKQVREGKIKI